MIVFSHCGSNMKTGSKLIRILCDFGLKSMRTLGNLSWDLCERRMVGAGYEQPWRVSVQ